MNSILTAFVNGLIVSAFLGLAVWATLALASRRLLNASTRYVVWCGTLMVSVIVPLLYAPVQPPSWLEQTSVANFQLHARRPVSIDPVSDSGSQSASGKDFLTPDPAELAPHRAVFPIRLGAGPWLTWIVYTWLLISFLMLIRLAIGFVLLERRKSRAGMVPFSHADQVNRWLSHCKAAGRDIQIVISREITAPMASGPYRPSILIPARFFETLTESELDQIGLHEAGHLRRRDDYVLLFQRAIEALFVFHPVVRWIARQIDFEREIACDDFVIEITGRPRVYAACLTKVIEFAGAACGPRLAASATGTSSNFGRRIEMLLDDTRKTGTQLLKRPLASVFGCLAALTLLALQAPGVVVFARPPQRAVDQVVEPAPKPNTSPVAVSAATLPAVPRQAPPQSGASNSIARNLVMVPVVVTDPRNRFVTGLAKEHFMLLENGIEQEISQFSADSEDLSIAIIFTGSELLKQAVEELIAAAKPNDEFSLIYFSNQQGVVAGFTRNRDAILNSLESATSDGPSSLLDAIPVALTQMAFASNPRKAIVVLSDGAEDSDRFTESQVTASTADTDLPIYAITATEQASGAGFLDNIAKQTGGRRFTVTDESSMRDAAEKTVLPLRWTYAIGFTSTDTSRDGSYRQLEVRLLPPRGLPPMTLHFRTGYNTSLR